MDAFSALVDDTGGSCGVTATHDSETPLLLHAPLTEKRTNGQMAREIRIRESVLTYEHDQNGQNTCAQPRHHALADGGEDAGFD